MASKPSAEAIGDGTSAPIISPVSIIDAVEGLMTLKAVDAAAHRSVPEASPRNSCTWGHWSDGSHTRSPSPIETDSEPANEPPSKRQCREAQLSGQPSHPAGNIQRPMPGPGNCLLPPGSWPGQPSVFACAVPLLSSRPQQLLPQHHQLLSPQPLILQPARLLQVGHLAPAAAISGPFPLALAPARAAPAPAAARSAEDMWLAASELLKRSCEK